MSLKRYAIWDKVSPIYTHIGEVLTAEQWKERYPIAELNNVKVVCSAGDINGGFFGTLNDMVIAYEKSGADFSDATTDEEKLEVIEAFEDEMNALNLTPTPEERMAAALEYQVLSNMPDE